MHSGGACKNDDISTAKALHAALEDFFGNKFPSLRKEPFFITGESCASMPPSNPPPLGSDGCIWLRWMHMAPMNAYGSDVYASSWLRWMHMAPRHMAPMHMAPMHMAPMHMAPMYMPPLGSYRVFDMMRV